MEPITLILIVLIILFLVGGVRYPTYRNESFIVTLLVVIVLIYLLMHH